VEQTGLELLKGAPRKALAPRDAELSLAESGKQLGERLRMCPVFQWRKGSDRG
jgi:hypothetical protein